jgi:hypothetical protein
MTRKHWREQPPMPASLISVPALVDKIIIAHGVVTEY